MYLSLKLRQKLGAAVILRDFTQLQWSVNGCSDKVFSVRDLSLSLFWGNWDEEMLRFIYVFLP